MEYLPFAFLGFVCAAGAAQAAPHVGRSTCRMHIKRHTVQWCYYAGVCFDVTVVVISYYDTLSGCEAKNQIYLVILFVTSSECASCHKRVWGRGWRAATTVIRFQWMKIYFSWGKVLDVDKEHTTTSDTMQACSNFARHLRDVCKSTRYCIQMYTHDRRQRHNKQKQTLILTHRT